MPTMDHTKEIVDLKRRVDLAETKLAQQSGQFEFISGQLRDVQLYLHARFADMDARFAGMDARFNGMDGRFDGIETKIDGIDGKVDALPRVIAEIIGKRD